MASINEKLNYINETKSLIKDKLNDLGSEIEDETTFRNYVEKIEDLYEEWPKINDEDIAITLNNTKKGKMNLQLRGNTNQYTTTGKNLWGGFSQSYTTSPTIGTITTNTNGTITLSGSGTAESNIYSITATNAKSNNIYKILSAGTYTASGGTDKYRLQVVNTEGTTIATTSASSPFSVSFTLSEATEVFLRAQIRSGITISNETLYFMLEEGSTASNYEPYTGGIASPNPDYPQDIQVVTGENTIKIEGKNQLNLKNNKPSSNGLNGTVNNGIVKINGTTTANAFIRLDNNEKNYYFEVIPAGTYSLSANNTITLSSNDKLRFVYNSGGTEVTGASVSLNNTNASTTFTLSEDIKNVNLQLRIAHPRSLENFEIKPQLEKNSSATEYEQYQSQIYSINLTDIELCKINDYQDYLYKKNNNWYKKPIILKIKNYNEETINTDYKSTTGSLTTGATIYYINPDLNPDGILITNETLINQLNALEENFSYDNQTNISQTNDNLPFIITASALLKNSN